MITETEYMEIKKQLHALFKNEHDAVANAANISAVLFQALTDVSWVGFYFYKNNELILGPFQGKPACMHIPLHKGVCGAAASNRKTYIISDVHAFEGHIACDSETASEIVIPLLYKDTLIGVLDIDSTSKNRFTTLDAQHLEDIVTIYVSSITKQ